MRRNKISAEPKEIYFELINPHDLATQHVAEFRLLNCSDNTVNVIIIPPSTQYFSLDKLFPEKFVPGSSILCTITFKPKDMRVYEEDIRVLVENQTQDLVIPLRAFPSVGNINFPKSLVLPVTPVGQTTTQKIPLKVESDQIFTFVLEKSEDNPSLTVSPLKGTVSSGEQREIEITFQPTEYTTCVITLRLLIDQPNFKPRICKIYAYAEPGVIRKLTERKVKPEERRKFQKTAKSFASETSSDGRKLKKTELTASGDKSRIQDGEVEPQIRCPHDVARFLMNQDQETSDPEVSRRKAQLKQQIATFESLIRQNEAEQHRCKTNGLLRPGQPEMPPEAVESVRKLWIEAWNEYLSKRTDPEAARERIHDGRLEIEQANLGPDVIKRIQRPVNQLHELEDFKPEFRVADLSTDSLVHQIRLLDRFRSAVGRIIFRQRAEKHLRKFRRLHPASIDDHTRKQTPVESIPRHIVESIGRPLQPPSSDDSSNATLPTSCDVLPSVNTFDLRERSHIKLNKEAELSSLLIRPAQGWSVASVSRVPSDEFRNIDPEEMRAFSVTSDRCTLKYIEQYLHSPQMEMAAECAEQARDGDEVED